MNERDIMYGFIEAPSSGKVKKPWVSCIGDRVISTNGVVMLSAKLDELDNSYSRWSSMTCSEPFANFVFGNMADDSYREMSVGMYDLIEGGSPLVEDDTAQISPIEMEYMGNPVKFDLWQMAPIYNACSFWDRGFFVAHARRAKCLLFKHITKDIEMAIKLL